MSMYLDVMKMFVKLMASPKGARAHGPFWAGLIEGVKNKLDSGSPRKTKEKSAWVQDSQGLKGSPKGARAHGPFLGGARRGVENKLDSGSPRKTKETSAWARGSQGLKARAHGFTVSKSLGSWTRPHPWGCI